MRWIIVVFYLGEKSMFHMIIVSKVLMKRRTVGKMDFCRVAVSFGIKKSSNGILCGKVRKYLLFYHIGLNLTAVMLVIRGVVQVLSLDASIAVLIGIAHLILGISMVLVLISIRNCIKDSF